MRNLTFFLVVLGALNSRLGASKSADRWPVVVVMGGFNSCPEVEGVKTFSVGQGLATTKEIFRSSSYQEKLVESFYQKTGRRPVTLFTCYSNLLFNSRLDTFHLRATFSDIDFSEFSQQTIGQKSLEDTGFLRPILEEIRDKLLRVEEDSDDSLELYVIGHSFGGFAAIHLVDYLKNRFQIGGVITVDAISPLTCSPKLVLSGLLRTAIGGHKGCKEFPADEFTQLAVKSIVRADRVSWWVNVYQKQFRQLHGGAIEDFEGHEPRYYNLKSRRFEVNEVPGFPYKDYHSKLAVDPLLWDELFDKRFRAGLELDSNDSNTDHF